jgi:hypothetical protein
MEFAYDGGGLGKGGDVALFVDGKPAGKGRVKQTEYLVFSADETLDIGNETGSPVTKDYKTRRFNSEVNWVEIDVDKDAEDVDHYIKPEERWLSRWRFNRDVRAAATFIGLVALARLRRWPTRRRITEVVELFG